MKKRINLLIPALLFTTLTGGVITHLGYQDIKQDHYENNVVTNIDLPMIRRANDNKEYFTGYNISLTDDISFCAIPTDNVSGKTVKFELLSNNEVVANQTISVTSSTEKIAFSKIAPQYLNGTVRITILNNEEEICTIDKSLSEYLYNDKVIGDEKFTSLVVDLLNYGSAAQEYTNTNIDNLVNKDLSNEQKELGSTYETPKTKFDISKSDNNYIATWYSANLWFSNKIGVDFKFNLKETKDNIKVEINGKEYEPTLTENTYLVRYDTLAPTEYNNEIKAKVLSGNEVISETLTYSINTYASRMSAADTKMANLAKAVYCYGKSANLVKNNLYSNQLQNGMKINNVTDTSIIGTVTNNDYTYNVNIDKTGLTEKYENNKYYLTKDNVDYEVDVSSKKINIDNWDYTSDDIASRLQGASYSVLKNSFIISKSGTTGELSLKSASTEEENLGNVIIDVQEDATFGNISFDGGYSNLTITGKDTNIKQLTSNANTTTLDTNITNDNQFGDVIKIKNGTLIINENVSLNMSSTNYSMPAIVTTGLISNGNITISGFTKGIEIKTFEDWQKGDDRFGKGTINGNLIIENCNVGVSSTKEFDINNGTTTIKSTSGAAIDVSNGATLNVIGGETTLESSSVTTIIGSNINVGSDSTNPVLNINSNSQGGITDNQNEANSSTYNFISGTTTITQNGSGHVGISVNNANDKIEVKENATLNINGYDHSISAWNTAQSGGSTFISNGTTNLIANEHVLKDLKFVKINGIFKGKLIGSNAKWGISCDVENSEYELLGGKITLERDSHGYAAFYFGNRISHLIVNEECEVGINDYDYAFYGSGEAKDINGKFYSYNCEKFAWGYDNVNNNINKISSEDFVEKFGE